MHDDDQHSRPDYERARAYLKSAAEHLIGAGRSARDLIDFARDRFGDAIVPELRRFLAEVREGRVNLHGLSESARAALLGVQVSPEERERQIREAAYHRAAQRGFVGGSPEADWAAAEREVDERLAREAGLTEKGRKALSSALTIAEKELGNVREVVARWIETRRREEQTRRTGGSASSSNEHPKHP
jgi:hypothetical protein